jgi:hypothetical protein
MYKNMALLETLGSSAFKALNFKGFKFVHGTNHGTPAAQPAV